MKAFFLRLSTLRSSFFRYNDEETLNRPSKIIILLMDCFILIFLFIGLREHSQQLTTPNDYLPSVLQDALIRNQWKEGERLDKLQGTVLIEFNRYSYQYKKWNNDLILKNKHPLVTSFYDKIETIKQDKTLFAQFKKRQQLVRDKSLANTQIKQNTDAYQTALLEDIAEVNTVLPDSPQSQQVQRLNKKLNLLIQEINLLENTIEKNPRVINFYDFLESNTYATQRTELIREFNRLERWFPLKEFLWQLLFLAPLFIVFYIWNSLALKKGNHIQILISSHLLLLVLLPILLRSGSFLLDLIPNHIFRDLFFALKSLKIIALWHYFVILAGILVTLFSIAILQKKLLSQERIRHKRTLAGNCYNCGKKLPLSSKACPSCSKIQFETCKFCNEQRLIGTICCNQCGKPVAKE